MGKQFSILDFQSSRRARRSELEAGTSSSGFTLIELLVVIAIIGLLSSVVLASLNTARKKGRDAKRVADIKQLQLALELAFDANGVYPTSLSTAALVTPGYIASIPVDPSNSQPYAYSPYALVGYGATCSGYHLGASLETVGHSALSADANVTTLSANSGETRLTTVAVCTGGAADFHGTNSAACQATDAGVACFDVKQ